MPSPAIGPASQLGVGMSAPVTYRLDFRSESLTRRDDSRDTNGVRWTRSRQASRVRASAERIGGPVRLQPTAADLHQLLPWALCGSTVTAGTRKWYKLGDLAVTRTVTVDRNAKVFTYPVVGIDRLKLSTAPIGPDQILAADLDLVACTESVGDAGTFPTLSLDTTTAPFVMSQLTLTVNGLSVSASKFELEVNNTIDRTRYLNSRTLTRIQMLNRVVTFRTSLPYGTFTTLYNLGAETGIVVTAVFRGGGSILTLMMNAVVFPPVSPTVPDREEVILNLEGKAYRTGDVTDDSGQELLIYLDTGT